MFNFIAFGELTRDQLSKITPKVGKKYYKYASLEEGR